MRVNNLSALINVIVVGLIGGIAVGLQGPMSGAMSQIVGPAGASLIIHLGGAILSAVIIAFVGGVNWQAVGSLPWPYFTAGLLGVVLYFSFAYTMPRAGVGITLALLIFGQMGLGLLIDHFGWMGSPVHPINFSRVLGMGAILIGAVLVSR